MSYAIYVGNESGFAIYDDVVKKMKDSNRYELVRYPLEVELENFNNQLIGFEFNTIFKNIEQNLVYLKMTVQTYGYLFDIIYLSLCFIICFKGRGK